ncbi:MAG: hypothetical protein ABIQ16_26840 [Polyangiaceae bacterium]
MSGKENDFENCFRRTVALLEPYTTSAEDKYSYEIFSLWIGEDCLLKVAPPELVAAFPDFLGSGTGYLIQYRPLAEPFRDPLRRVQSLYS